MVVILQVGFVGYQNLSKIHLQNYHNQNPAYSLKLHLKEIKSRLILYSETKHTIYGTIILGILLHSRQPSRMELERLKLLL